MAHLTKEQLEAGLASVTEAPHDDGALRLIVRRPGVDAREVVEQGALDADEGLVGDDWVHRPGSDGAPNRYAQLTVMNARYAALVADSVAPDDWAQAGDQLYIDMDISEENLPAGTKLQIGDATIVISAEPHMGCAKFSARFGSEAWKLANSPQGRTLRLRGANASVDVPGIVRTGDVVRKV